MKAYTPGATSTGMSGSASAQVRVISRNSAASTRGSIGYLIGRDGMRTRLAVPEAQATVRCDHREEWGMAGPG